MPGSNTRPDPAPLPADEPGTSGTVVAVSTMQSKDGRREDLLAVLTELAPQIRAEPGCLQYSVHRARNDADGPLLIIQQFASTEAFRRHSASMADQIPRIGALLATPPVPPALFEPVPRSVLTEDLTEDLGRDLGRGADYSRAADVDDMSG